MTVGNAKAIDLFVEKGRRTANIQVKAIRNRASVGWPMTRATVWSNVVYALICLNGTGTFPDFFIESRSTSRAAFSS